SSEFAQPAGAGTAPEPAAPATAQPEPTAAADAEPPEEFLRELVAAMRRVAEETKQAGLADARARADERVKQLEADGERRRQELSTGAETDIAAVGEWAKAEAERIKAEAERRVSARRTQLDEQLAADQARGEADAKAVRDRIGDYERELEAYHAQLAEISDPAAFAAAAKRMPRPPVLEGATTATPDPATAPAPAPATAPTVADATPPPSTNGQQPATDEVHPAEEEVLAARLAELDATLPADPVAETAAAPTATAAPDTTEVVVSGLGSFGAITSFRQALADVDGVQGVALSLGGSGEFVFRATHRPGFDIGAAIASLEGDAAKVQPRPEGGLLVKLERRR
ncbi:MAG TPA: hypothetical protein VLS46_04210, partial [Gaiellaceae bacterium]|nr:hypothetical protein [Gaiellaceae bacterium]